MCTKGPKSPTSALFRKENQYYCRICSKCTNKPLDMYIHLCDHEDEGIEIDEASFIRLDREHVLKGFSHEDLQDCR